MITGFVYFAVSAADCAVKIGYSRSPRDRIQSLKLKTPDLELLGVVPGTLYLESALHKRFETHEITGRNEWFHDCPEIRAYCHHHLVPLTAGMMRAVPVKVRSRCVFFRATQREFDAVKEAAESRSMSPSEWMRRVIQQKLGMEETV